MNRVPLAFSQRAHWNLYQLGQRPAVRQVASATRLVGRLNVDALRRSIAEIVRRHDSLRARVVVCDGVPLQEIDPPGDYELAVEDLTAIPESELAAAIQGRIESLILEPIDVSRGPLFGAQLLRLRNEECVLVIAMEHMISDAASMGIILREIATAYPQAARGGVISLPVVPAQFTEYALWQRGAGKAWIDERLTYWNRRLSGSRRVRFPQDTHPVMEATAGWSAVSFELGKSLKAELRSWCRTRRTTLVMSILTVYAGLVLRWCNVPEAVIRIPTLGRVGPKAQQIVGFMASKLYLRIALSDRDDFVELLRRVTQEYWQCYEHDDCECLESQTPQPEFARNTLFNWIPRDPRMELPQSEATDGLQSAPFPFANPSVRGVEWDNEPTILFYETEDRISGAVYFPTARFSPRTMERFVKNFRLFLERLLRRPEDRVMNISLV